MTKKTTLLFTALLLILTVFLSNQSIAQSTCPWAKKAGGNNVEFGVAVATDASGNVYYLGNFYSQTINIGGTILSNQPYIAFNYGAEMFLAKYDSCGTFKWAKKAGGITDVYGTGLAVDAAGDVYVSGWFNADTAYFGTTKLVNNSLRDAFLVKYDPNGIAQWAKAGGGNDWDMAYGVAVDGLNNVYITGPFSSKSMKFGTDSILNGIGDDYTYDIFIAKFDVNGNFQWLRGNTSNVSTNSHVISYGIAADATGNVFVCGRFASNYIRFNNDSLATNGYYDLFVVKYDGSGAEQWLRTAGAGDADRAYSLAVDATGGVFVGGYIGTGTVSFGANSITNTGFNRNVFLAKYDASGGNDFWAKTVGSTQYSDNICTSVRLDVTGNAYITGTYSADSLNVGPVTLFNTSYLGGNGGDYFYDIFVAKYKSNGFLSWARTAGGDSTDIGNCVATGPNGALYLTGEFKSPTISLAGIPLTLASGSLQGNGDAFICNNIATLMVTPDICLVSADTTILAKEYNVVYWDKTPFTTVNNFIVYREVTSGVYKKIGSQPYSALSMFIDTTRSVGPANGDPNVSTYRYKIQFMDTAGSYSFLSPYHNTVYFQNNAGTFNWNLYSVENMTITPVTQFDLVRDDLNTGAWAVIGTTAGTQTTLNDPNYATHQAIANWRVEAQGFTCTPTMRLGNNANQTVIIKSKSNITNNRGIGINQLANTWQLEVYPNPAKGVFVIETNLTEKQNIQVIDVNGKIVLSTVITGTTSIDAGNLTDGVYTICIVNNSNVANKRLVIVK